MVAFLQLATPGNIVLPGTGEVIRAPTGPEWAKLHDVLENVIEMDIAVMKDEEELERSWTSDSEDDSSPSPSENSFTSDTDISSSSTCSSSSCDESSSNNKK